MVEKSIGAAAVLFIKTCKGLETDFYGGGCVGRPGSGADRRVDELRAGRRASTSQRAARLRPETPARAGSCARAARRWGSASGAATGGRAADEAGGGAAGMLVPWPHMAHALAQRVSGIGRTALERLARFGEDMVYTDALVARALAHSASDSAAMAQAQHARAERTRMLLKGVGVNPSDFVASKPRTVLATLPSFQVLTTTYPCFTAKSELHGRCSGRETQCGCFTGIQPSGKPPAPARKPPKYQYHTIPVSYHSPQKRRRRRAVLSTRCCPLSLCEIGGRREHHTPPPKNRADCARLAFPRRAFGFQTAPTARTRRYRLRVCQPAFLLLLCRGPSRLGAAHAPLRACDSLDALLPRFLTCLGLMCRIGSTGRSQGALAHGRMNCAWRA